MSSLFTKIAQGEVPASFVFREDHWFGILDLYPVHPGHLLLIPDHESALVQDLPAEHLAAMGPTIARACACMRRALGCDAISVLVRDGGAAGQEIPHVHVHCIPRMHGDDEHIGQSAMDDLVAKLKAAW